MSVVPALAGVPDAELIAKRTRAIKAFFLERIGLEPFEEGRVYIHYLVARWALTLSR